MRSIFIALLFSLNSLFGQSWHTIRRDGSGAMQIDRDTVHKESNPAGFSCTIRIYNFETKRNDVFARWRYRKINDTIECAFISMTIWKNGRYEIYSIDKYHGIKWIPVIKGTGEDQCFDEVMNNEYTMH